MPNVSIIVPIYNSEDYLVECLDSLINQSLQEIEIILINDGSSDNSGRICNQYAKNDNRVRVIHKKNEGVSIARNTGISIARGNWITFVDSDDWIDIKMCELAYETSIQENADFIFCNNFCNYPTKEIEMTMFDDDKKTFSGNDIKELQLLIIDSLRLGVNFVSNLTFPWGKFIKRETLKKLKNNLFPPELKWGEDQLFNLNFLQETNKAIYVNKKLYHYRLHGDSLSTAFCSDRLDICNKYIKLLWEFIEQNYKGDKEFVTAFNARIYYITIFLIRVYFCHKDNKAPIFKRIKELDMLLKSEPYITALSSIDMKCYKTRKKIFLFFARNRISPALFLLGLVNDF